MRDSELAASIVEGDPGALAETYDKYADLLWSYCYALLGDGHQAAGAVADTFVVASSRLDVLPTGARLRAWLYAVARVECLRRARAAKESRAPVGAERLRHTAAMLSTGEQRQLRTLLSDAFTGLDDDERDVMQMIWHGLDLAEVAVILGMTRSDAYALFTRARDQLEATVGVMLMGWSGYGGCDEFEEMLYGRDSKLTPELRARLSRHIERCETCTESYRRQMRPSLLLCLSVGALLSEAADARAAARQAPAGLWEQVYQMTSSASPESRWHKILGGRRLTFGPDGFPKQLASGRDGLASPVKVAAVGVVAVAATATGWATHGHFAGSPGAAASNASRGIAPVSPKIQAAAAPAAGKGAHAGKPSAKTTSGHKAAHAKPQPAGSSPSALPGTSASGTTVPVSSGSSSSGSTSTSSGSTSSGSSGSTSSGSTSSGSTSSGSGSSTSGSGTSTGSSPAPAPTTTSSTNPVSGLVNGLGKTVGGVVGGL